MFNCLIYTSLQDHQVCCYCNVCAARDCMYLCVFICAENHEDIYSLYGLNPTKQIGQIKDGRF